jgi:hypothetical protein
MSQKIADASAKGRAIFLPPALPPAPESDHNLADGISTRAVVPFSPCHPQVVYGELGC